MNRMAEAKIERERTVIGHPISATDRQIDNLVYELYGLRGCADRRVANVSMGDEEPI